MAEDQCLPSFESIVKAMQSSTTAEMKEETFFNIDVINTVEKQANPRTFCAYVNS